MHICIVGSSKKFFSGISAYTIVMANAFAERGHEVSVILMRNLCPLRLYPGRDRVGKGDYLTDFRPEIDVYNGMDWNSPLSWADGYRFLKRKRPDAIIIHWWTSSVAHMLLLLALGKRINRTGGLILEMHEVVDTLEEKMLPIRLYARLAGKTLINLCDEYTAHSVGAREDILRIYKMPAHKIHVVPHGPYNMYGSSNRDLSRRDLNLEGFTILYFGMIREYKGVSLLIKAFNKLPADIAKRTHLIIAGEDWGDDVELAPALNRSPYRSRIVFESRFIPDDMVSKYFAAADIVVLPYLRTCGSGVLNIAMAQGKPVIAANLATMCECLAEYQGAHFFPAGNIEALGEKIVESYNRWLTGKMKTYNHPGVTWNEIVQKYEQIYERMASSKCV